MNFIIIIIIFTTIIIIIIIINININIIIIILILIRILILILILILIIIIVIVIIIIIFINKTILSPLMLNINAIDNFVIKIIIILLSDSLKKWISIGRAIIHPNHPHHTQC